MGNKIYVVLWHDRHVDETVHLFTDKDAAVSWARQQAEDNTRPGGGPDDDDTAELNDTDWVAYFPYNVEGDYLRVLAVDVDAEVSV